MDEPVDQESGNPLCSRKQFLAQCDYSTGPRRQPSAIEARFLARSSESRGLRASGLLGPSGFALLPCVVRRHDRERLRRARERFWLQAPDSVSEHGSGHGSNRTKWIASAS